MIDDVMKNRPCDLILTDFGRLIEIGDIAFDDADECYLQIGEDVVGLHYFEATEFIVVRAIVGSVPIDPQPSLFVTLLMANHLAAGKSRGSLSIDDEIGAICWNLALPMEGLTTERLFDAVRHAPVELAFWSGQVADILGAEDDRQAALMQDEEAADLRADPPASDLRIIHA